MGALSLSLNPSTAMDGGQSAYFPAYGLAVQGAVTQHAMAGSGYKHAGVCQKVKKCSNFDDACRNSVLLGFRLCQMLEISQNLQGAGRPVRE